METKNVNETMNQVIVRLNELKDVKMSSVTKSKRQAAKFSKEVATYLLDNWTEIREEVFDWRSKNGKWWKKDGDTTQPTDKPAQE